MSAQDDPRTSSTLLVSLIGTILLLAVIVLAQVMFYDVQRVEDITKVEQAEPQALLQLQAEQLAQITTYRIVDAKEGIVAVPIDRAIELYVADVKSQPPPSTINRAQSEPEKR